jgi:hypothetical protein
MQRLSITESDIEDFIEYAIKEINPEIKTKRSNDGIEVTLRRKRFHVKASKIKRLATTSLPSPVSAAHGTG